MTFMITRSDIQSLKIRKKFRRLSEKLTNLASKCAVKKLLWKIPRSSEGRSVPHPEKVVTTRHCFSVTENQQINAALTQARTELAKTRHQREAMAIAQQRRELMSKELIARQPGADGEPSDSEASWHVSSPPGVRPEPQDEVDNRRKRQMRGQEFSAFR